MVVARDITEHNKREALISEIAKLKKKVLKLSKNL